MQKSAKIDYMSTVKIPPIFQPLLNNKIFKGLPQQTFLYYTEDVLDQVLEHQNSAACLAGICHEASGAVRLLRTLRCAAVAARGALDGRGGGDGTVLAGRALHAKLDVGRSRVWLIEAGNAVDRVDCAPGAPVSAGARRTVYYSLPPSPPSRLLCPCSCRQRTPQGSW